MKPEFLVSTATQIYRPLPPKWLRRKTHNTKNFQRPARESLKDLETLAEIRSKLGTFDDTTQVDRLIDHKLNLHAQFTPRNAFDEPEERQLDRLSRLTEVRKNLEGTDYALAHLDAVLKLGFENLVIATGISRAHSVCLPACPAALLTPTPTNRGTEFLTAHLDIQSFQVEAFSIRPGSHGSSVSLFFNDRTREIQVYQNGKQSYWEGNEIKIALLDIWKATWAEKSARICFHLFKVHDSRYRYESCMMEMKAVEDARGVLQKLSGISNFKICCVKR
ncbi:MAG: hypothetical protein Q9168_003538 [Polycauliona sp. 1 TL-2023]